MDFNELDSAVGEALSVSLRIHFAVEEGMVPLLALGSHPAAEKFRTSHPIGSARQLASPKWLLECYMWILYLNKLSWQRDVDSPY